MDTGSTCSGEQSIHRLTLHVGQAELATLKTIGEPLMIEAEEMQDGGMEIVHRDGIASDIPGEVVGLAIDLADLHAAPGHPQAEGAGMVIAPGDLLKPRTVFAERGAAKLGAPDDERGVEQA